MDSDDDIVTRFAKISLDIVKEKNLGKAKALKDNGMSEESFKELEINVSTILGDNGTIITEYGRVQMKPPGKVQMYPLRSARSQKQKPFLIYDKEQL